MTELIKINLLPYREEIKQRKRQQFKILMLSSLLIGIGLSAIAYLAINSAISDQESRNAFLEAEIIKLDNDLGEIKKLQQEKENFLAKKQKVEELQEKRSQAAYIIDSLNVVIPDNTYITSLDAENPTSYKITGRAISDNKIAMFMRSLPSTGIFTQPELLEIKKIDNYQEFNIKSMIGSASIPVKSEREAINDDPMKAQNREEKLMASAKVKNLDIQNLYLLNPAAKFVLAASAVAGVLAVGYGIVFRDQLETLSTQEAKEAELKETYTKKSIEAASLDNLKAELTSIRSSFDILLKQLPTDAEIPTLIQELHQAGSANGLRLDSVVPQVPVNDGPIQKLPYEISITGKYNQINQFARDVGGLSRIITLESLKISHVSDSKNGKDSKNDILTLRAIATTYKARPSDEVAAELAAQQSQAQGDSENGQANSEQK